MPHASFSHQVAIPRPRKEVWARLQDVNTWADIGPVEEVWDPVYDHDGSLLGYRWSTTVALRRYSGKAQVIQSTPPELMVLELDGGEVAGTLTAHLLEEVKRQTTLVVTLDIEPKGMMATLFFSVVADAVAKGLPQQVDRFADSFSAA